MALQKQFRGLDNFVGAYTLGKLTLDLGGVLQPQMDVSLFVEPPRDAYATEDLDSYIVNTQIFPFTVPSNEIWLMHALGFHTDGALNGDLELLTCVKTPNNTSIRGFERRDQFSGFTNTLVATGGIHFASPVFLEPGTDAGWTVIKLSGTTPGRPNLLASIQYQRIGI